MVPLDLATGETIEAEAVTLPIESASWGHESPLFELDSGEGPKVMKGSLSFFHYFVSRPCHSL